MVANGQRYIQFFLINNTKLNKLKEVNKNKKIDNTDKKLNMPDVNDSLFDKLKEVIVEYCSLSDNSSIDDELEYHIKRYETYIHRIKTGFKL